MLNFVRKKIKKWCVNGFDHVTRLPQPVDMVGDTDGLSHGEPAAHPWDEPPRSRPLPFTWAL